MERSSTKNGYISMAFLALQFGLQPILSKEFASNVKFSSSLVVSCEIVKLSTALCILIASGKVHKIWTSWNLYDSLRCSGLPACTYAIQNVLIQISYQNLPPIVFNLVNQTKLLWTAVFVYVLLNRAMVILLFAAVLLSLTDREDSVHHQHSSGNASFETGFLPVIAASALSGFGAAMTQRSMQVHQRDAALVTMELSMYGSIFLVLSAITTQRDTMGEFVSLSNGTALYEFVAGWDSFTFIPVISNALGGILVGNVTKYVGGVMKSFALIVGIAFTAFLEAYLYNESISIHVWIAAVLVIISMSMYNAYPYEEKKKTE